MWKPPPPGGAVADGGNYGTKLEQQLKQMSSGGGINTYNVNPTADSYVTSGEPAAPTRPVGKSADERRNLDNAPDAVVNMAFKNQDKKPFAYTADMSEIVDRSQRMRKK